MLPRLDSLIIPPPGPAERAAALAPLGEGRQAAFQRALQTLVGQAVPGQILAQMNDGSYLVRVAGNAARMALPPGVQVGTEVPLTVIAAQPRPVFQFGQTASGQPALYYPEAMPHGAEAEAAARAPAQPASAATVTLSRAGTDSAAHPPAAAALPGAALPGAADAADAAGPAAARPGPAGTTGSGAAAPHQPSLGAALLARAPLTPAGDLPALDPRSPPAELSAAARQLAAVLKSAPSLPGTPVLLHGKTPLVEGGAPEPARLAGQLRDTLAHSGLFYESHVGQWSRGELPLSELQREPQMQRAAVPAGTAASAAADQAGNVLIGQQLLAHEQGRVQWQGEAWPGQAMQWEVQRHGEHEQGHGQPAGRDGEAPLWRSAVRFRFPLLGQVEASVTLHGGQLQIQLAAGSDASAATLRAHAASLEQALAAAGASLASLTIGSGERHEP